MKLSILIISKNAEETIEKSLDSVRNLGDEIVLVDNGSTDNTVNIAKKYNVKIFLKKEEDLGRLRQYALNKCNGKWVLVIDSDEVVSKELSNEIKSLLIKSNKIKHCGFLIPFQNHFLNKKIYYGGEDYKKLIFFKKDCVKIEPALVHEKFELKKGSLGELKNKVYHYSYRSLFQMYKKFTDYALREAKQKFNKGEKSSLKKIILYPLHMFYARFIKDKGYKDGVFRIPLDLGFAYMEFITYLLLLFKNVKIKMQNEK